jgi:hypothetical protein
MNKMAIHTETGYGLDAIGSGLGLKREDGETDESFRERLLRWLPTEATMAEAWAVLRDDSCYDDVDVSLVSVHWSKESAEAECERLKEEAAEMLAAVRRDFAEEQRKAGGRGDPVGWARWFAGGKVWDRVLAKHCLRWREYPDGVFYVSGPGRFVGSTVG